MPDGYEIRPVEPKEAGRFFARVLDTLFQAGGIEPAKLQPDNTLRCDAAFVAQYEGKTVAALTLYVDVPLHPAYIDALFVCPKHRGKGLGLELCLTAMKRFRDAGKREARCIVKSEGMARIIERLPEEFRQMIRAEFDYDTFPYEIADSPDC